MRQGTEKEGKNKGHEAEAGRQETEHVGQGNRGSETGNGRQGTEEREIWGIEDRRQAKFTGNETKPQTFRYRNFGSKQDENVTITIVKKNRCQNGQFHFVPKFMRLKRKHLGLF